MESTVARRLRRTGLVVVGIVAALLGVVLMLGLFVTARSFVPHIPFEPPAATVVKGASSGPEAVVLKCFQFAADGDVDSMQKLFMGPTARADALFYSRMLRSSRGVRIGRPVPEQLPASLRLKGSEVQPFAQVVGVPVLFVLKTPDGLLPYTVESRWFILGQDRDSGAWVILVIGGMS